MYLFSGNNIHDFSYGIFHFLIYYCIIEHFCLNHLVLRSSDTPIKVGG